MMDSSYLVWGLCNNSKPEVSLAELLYDSLQSKQQSETLLIEESTGEEIPRGELLQSCIKLAVIMQKLRTSKGDRIGIITANTWKFSVPAVAALFIGATVTPINPTASKDDLYHYLNLSTPKILFISHTVLDKVKDVRRDLSFLEHVILLDTEDVDNGELILNELISGDVNCEKFLINKDKSVEALIVYSSGTTGYPKGVVLTQENVLNCMIYCSDSNFLNINKDSIMLGVLPLFHIFGLLLMYTYIWTGKRIILSPKFKPQIFLNSIQKYEVTDLITVPPLLLFLAKSPLVEDHDMSSIKNIFCGAAPLGKEVERMASQRFNIPIRQLYGLSECAAITIMPPNHHKAGSVGRLVMGHHAKVIDPKTGHILGPNTNGEICFKGPCVMKGYVNNEEETRKVIDTDGFLHTGDIGHFDEDGNLFILDRIKDIIKYKGFQVPPAQLEDILKKHAAVKDAAVIGRPDEKAGELPTAFVARHPNVEISEQEIMNYVAERVSVEKRLHGGVIFMNQLPQTASGKVLKKELKKLLL